MWMLHAVSSQCREKKSTVVWQYFKKKKSFAFLLLLNTVNHFIYYKPQNPTYLNVIGNNGYYTMNVWALVSHSQLGTALSSSVVHKDSLKSLNWRLCSHSGVELRHRTKAGSIDFSHTACHRQLVAFSSWNCPFQSTWPTISFPLPQGIMSTLTTIVPSLIFNVVLLHQCETFQGLAVQCFPLFPSYHSVQYAQLSHSLRDDSLKTTSIIHFFWQGCIIA